MGARELGAFGGALPEASGAYGFNPPELRAYQPSWRDRIALALQNVLPEQTVEGLMGSRGLGPTQKNAGMGLVDFTPLGIPLAVNEAQRSGEEGDWLGATLNAAAVVPGAKAGLHGVNRARTFFRGTNPGKTERIVTGKPTWDSHLFAADNQDAASMYGSQIEKLEAAPDAKILYQGSAEWNRIAGKQRKDENLLDYADRAAAAAKAAGYDAAWFERQSDVGTAIFNPDKFTRGPIEPAAPPGIRAYHGSPHEVTQAGLYGVESAPMAGRPKIIGQDAAGRPVYDFRGSTVSHFTDPESAADIQKGGYRVVGDGYYGEAVSFTPNRDYGRQFGGVETEARIADDAKILNSADPKDWEIIQKVLNSSKYAPNNPRPGQKTWRQGFIDMGYDGLYDAGAGDLFIYNTAKVKPLAK